MTKRLLYVGAGHDRATPFPELFDGYEVVRLDLDPTTEPDICVDARCLGDSYCTTPSFDGVALQHVLEHVDEQDGATVLRGCAHVLAPGGRVAVACPNLWLACRILADNDPEAIVYKTVPGDNAIRPLDMLYGWQWAKHHGAGHPLMGHQWGYTARTLEMALRRAGFDVASIAGAEGTELRAVGVKR